MTTSKGWVLALFVAFLAVWLIVNHSVAALIAVGVALVSMAAAAWYVRKERVSSMPASGRGGKRVRTVKVTALALVVAAMVALLIIEHDVAAFIAVGVAVVSMAAGAWYGRKLRL